MRLVNYNILYTASRDISYFLGSADTMNIYLSVPELQEAVENLNFVLSQSLVHNKMPRSNLMCAFNFKSVVKTSMKIYYHWPYNSGIQACE